MKELYIPMIRNAVTKEIPDAMNHIRPIPGLKVVHNTNEANLKRSAEEATAGHPLLSSNLLFKGGVSIKDSYNDKLVK